MFSNLSDKKKKDFIFKQIGNEVVLLFFSYFLFMYFSLFIFFEQILSNSKHILYKRHFLKKSYARNIS